MRLDYTNMMKATIGDGINELRLDRAAFDKVISGLGEGWQQWCNLPSDDGIYKIVDHASRIRKKFSDVVVLGIGGSALGTEAIACATLHLHHNELPRTKRNAPRFYVEDNIDPDRMNALLDVINIDKTMFFVVTKSGETSETLSQYLIISDILRKRLGEKAHEHIISITSVGKGTLFRLTIPNRYDLYGIREGIGGRFSVFSPVGLVPLACVGVDIRELIRGARRAKEYCTRWENNPALIMATLNMRAYEMGRNISVMMPYSDGLRLVSDFYAQLWGESLGKLKDGVGVGQTPVKALGVTDQHSQIQLYTEGPSDKVVTLIKVANPRSDVPIPDDGTDELRFLKGKSLGTLLSAECDATAFALRKAGKMNMTLTIDDLSPRSIGELLTVLMYATAYAGAILGVNTYDQPGVEEGKKATFAMMGKEGYEDKLTELKSASCGEYISEN